MSKDWECEILNPIACQDPIGHYGLNGFHEHVLRVIIVSLEIFFHKFYHEVILKL